MPLRGDRDDRTSTSSNRDDRTSTSSNRDDRTSTSSNRGNFWAVLEMMSKHRRQPREHLESGRKNAQYTSRIILNEVIEVVVEYIRKEHTRSLEDENAFFSIMANEVTDPHGNQILSVCLRMLAHCKVKQFFFDLLCIERTTGEAIAHGVVECLKDRNIDISKARGQSYDGAQCMSSAKIGVQAMIEQLSTRALYVHCRSTESV